MRLPGEIDLAAVESLVVGDGHAEGSEHLDALVVAIGRLARDVDRGDRAVGMREHGDSEVDVTGLADRGIDEVGALGPDLHDRRADDERGHVEVVDHHVDPDPAAHPHVLHRRRRRVAARHARHPHIADAPAHHGVAHRAVAGIETPVEAHHEGHARALEHLRGSIDLGEVEAHRLLAEDRLARFRCRDDVVDMGVGRGADRDRIRQRDDFLSAHRGHAVRRTHLGRRRGVDIAHRRQGRARGLAGDVVRMHAADAACADDADAHDAVGGGNPAHVVSLRVACSLSAPRSSSTVRRSTSAARTTSTWLGGARPPTGGSRSRLVGKG